MASGRQASLKPDNTNSASLYTCPVDKVAIATVRAVNNDGTAHAVTIWLDTGSTSDADIITPGVTLEPNSILEEAGLVMGAGDTIHVKAHATGPNFVCWALEEDA